MKKYVKKKTGNDRRSDFVKRKAVYIRSFMRGIDFRPGTWYPPKVGALAIEVAARLLTVMGTISRNRFRKITVKRYGRI